MKLKNLILLFIGAIVLSSCGKSIKTNAQLKTDLDSISYVLGVDIANSLEGASIEELNYSALINGLTDAFDNKDLKIKEEEIKPYIQKYFASLQTKKNAKNLEEGRAFLEANKKKEGIITTESGLQYEIITEGTGKSPIATDKVKCHYHGTLIDGTVFESSVESGNPIDFIVNGVIPGWIEGLQLMKEGAKYRFYIPAELAYGERVRPGGPIQPNMALIFEVELIEVLGTPEAEVKKN